MTQAQLKLSNLLHHPILQKIVYGAKIRRPKTPHVVGMKFFQEHSVWVLDADRCPCDLEFIDYLQEFNIQGKSIFHFGTGEHHIIGLENQQHGLNNEIMGITAAAPEHSSYVNFVVKNPELAKYYKVLFADIYTLTANSLPEFDIVNLFHLCEFYLPENSKFTHHCDRTLVQLFLDKLKPDGKILFYPGSFAWSEAEKVVEEFTQTGKIRKVGEYKHLWIYEKCEMGG